MASHKGKHNSQCNEPKRPGTSAAPAIRRRLGCDQVFQASRTSRANAKGSADTRYYFLGSRSETTRSQDLIGMPVTVLSGSRCEKFNARKIRRSRPVSSHFQRRGKPRHLIRCQTDTEPFSRFAFLTQTLPLFNRIGIGKDSFHVDDDIENTTEPGLALLNKGVIMALTPDDKSDCQGRVGRQHRLRSSSTRQPEISHRQMHSFCAVSIDASSIQDNYWRGRPGPRASPQQ